VNCGSVFLVRSTSPTGQEWLAEHIPEDAQWFGGAVAVEHHDVGNIIQGAIDGGPSIGGGSARFDEREPCLDRACDCHARGSVRLGHLGPKVLCVA
jgi:hypothetical protein